MKFSYLLSACVLTLAMGACNNQPKETPAAAPIVIEKEVVREVVVEAPKEEAPVKKEEVKREVVTEKKSTTVKINSDGGSLKTDKVDIEIGH